MTLTEVARVPLPTPFGSFETRAFEAPSGSLYLALVAGSIGNGSRVLARLHSECLTGDVLGSLRCDCGVQLQAGLRTIASEGRGVLVYATGQEGRGIGLVNKLRAYMRQDAGLDTVDANLHLGLPVDGRDYAEAAEALVRLGVKSVRLVTNNPRKVEGLEAHGVCVDEVRPLPVASHVRNLRYLSTKRERMGHANPLGQEPVNAVTLPTDVTQLVGRIEPREQRPFVIVKYAQSVDGRIATASGDSKWISSEHERALSHAVRAHCDAILVGVGTILADDPQLTVRLVPGASPIRVVLDSTLRIPSDAHVVSDDGATLIITTEKAEPARRGDLMRLGVGVRAVDCGVGGVDIRAALELLRAFGIQSLVVEGGAQVITSLLRQEVVDRVIVSIAPKLLGDGTEGVGDLGTERVVDGMSLIERCVSLVGDDVVIAGSLRRGIQGFTATSASGAHTQAASS